MSRPTSTRLYEYEGEMLSLHQISKRTGIGAQTLRHRIINKGMTLREAISVPIDHSRYRQHRYLLRGKPAKLSDIVTALYIGDSKQLYREAEEAGMDVQTFINSEVARLDECERKTALFLARLREAGEAVKRRRRNG